MKIAVCLAGGGIKAAAHIGALKALEENNLNIDCITGTSSGSIVAVLYAAGYSVNEIKSIFNIYAKKIKYFDFKNIINIIKRIILERKFLIEGLNSGEIISKFINEFCNKKEIFNISDLKKDLIIASVSVNTGKVYFFESTKKEYRYSDEFIHINDINIGKAVQASCSFPGVFCPCTFKNDKLIDGGIRENVPWKETIKLGMDEIIGITFDEKEMMKKEKNIIDIISSSINLMGRELANYELIGINNIIKIRTKEVSLLDYSKIEYLYSQGYYQTKKYLENNIIK